MLNLKKNETLNLTKEVAELRQVRIGLGWDTNTSGRDYDLDGSVLLLDEKGKIFSQEKSGFFKAKSSKPGVICYYNKKSLCGGVIHTGDNLTGEGEGDDEVILLDLDNLNPEVAELLLVVNIYEGKSRNQKFGEVKNAYIRLIDDKTSSVVAKYSLTDNYDKETGMIFGKLSKINGEWVFKAIGEGSQTDLDGFIRDYK